MSDEQAVYRNCRAAQDAGVEIDDGTARTIGAWYDHHGPIHEFVTTGTVSVPPAELWSRMTWNGSLYHLAGTDGKLSPRRSTYALGRVRNHTTGGSTHDA